MILQAQSCPLLFGPIIGVNLNTLNCPSLGLFADPAPALAPGDSGSGRCSAGSHLGSAVFLHFLATPEMNPFHLIEQAQAVVSLSAAFTHIPWHSGNCRASPQPTHPHPQLYLPIASPNTNQIYNLERTI